MYYLLFFYLWFIIYLEIISGSTRLPTSEYAALHDFYISTHGQNWTWDPDYSSLGYPWNFVNQSLNDPCSKTFPWQGITCTTFCTRTNCHVLIIILNHHNLKGTIPASIGQFTQMTYINLNNNLLNGTIPTTINQLINVRYLYLDDNLLSGTIPVELCQLPQLQYLYLYNNRLTGSLPSEIGQLTRLLFLYLDNNLFTGTIPSSIGQITNLLFLYLDNNLLSGTIPKEISTFYQLTTLYLNWNLMTGTIPSEIGSLIQLTGLFLDDNFFTGTIPYNLSQLPYLTGVYFDNNQFNGSIDSLNFQSRLKAISFSTNYFTSMIPSSLFTIIRMEYIDFSNNYFSSSISFEDNNTTMFHSNLTFLDFSTNLFTNSFPFPMFYQCNRLIYLNLANNYFIGSFPDISKSMNNQLEILFLQNNSFTGRLPSNLLGQGHLKVFIALMNCFSGTLPSSLCNNQHLIQLNLDGLHSSSTCITKLTFWLGSSSYITQQSVGGNIPSCLFDLPSLVSLHLSGNNFDGSLPSHISSTSSKNTNLTIVNVANNQLTGVIPSYLLSNPKMFNLDLSFNQFDAFGEDIDAIKAFINPSSLAIKTNNTWNTSTIQSNLRLHVNHLSGNIPKGWKTTPSIDILEGNMFDCDIQRNDLPINDSLYDSYQCGSNDTNVSMYVVVGCSMICLICFLFWFGSKTLIEYLLHHADFGTSWLQSDLTLLFDAYQLPQSIVSNHTTLSSPSVTDLATTLKVISETNAKSITDTPISDMTNPINNDPSSTTTDNTITSASNFSLPHLSHMIYICQKISQWIYYLALWLIVIVTTMYICLTWYYGTYKHQYIWILSSSYLSGFSAAMIMFFIYLITMLWYIHEWYPIIQQKNHMQEVKQYSLLQCNLASLYQLTTHLHYTQLFLQCMFVFVDISIVLSINILYVLALNHGYSFTTMFMISILISIFKLVWNNLFHLGEGRKWIERRMNISFSGSLILFVCLFNNIIIPYIAEAFVSSNCFLYLITNPPKVQTTYYNVECSPQEICIDNICFITVKCNTPSLEAAILGFNMTIDTIKSANITCSEGYNCWNNVIDSITKESPLISTSYLPPFHYNFTCSSSLLSAFAFIFVYRYIMSVFLVPMFLWLIKQCQKNYQQLYTQSFIHNLFFSTKEQFLFFITLFLPSLMKFEYQFNFTTDKSHEVSPQPNDIELSQEEVYKENTTKLSPETHHICSLILEKSSERLILKEQSQSFVINLILDLTMFMSFGILFPPLGLLIICSIIRHATNYIYLIHNLVKYLLLVCSTKENLSLSTDIQHNITTILNMLCLLNQQSSQSNQLFGIGFWWTMVVAAWFWAICLYDTIGRSQGPMISLWILFVMGCGPYLCLVIYHWVSFKNGIANKQNCDTNIEKNLTITTVKDEDGLSLEMINPILITHSTD